MPDLKQNILESSEEHHVADVLLMELATMKPRPNASTPR